MRPLLVAAVVLALLPLGVQAQKRGTAPPDWDKMGKSSSATTAQLLTRKEVEEMEPVGLLVDKRKDLKLNEAQFASLKAMEAEGKVRDASLYEAMDSLRKELRGAGAGGDDARQRMAAAREEFAKVVGRIRANFAADATTAVAALDESQRAAATTLLEKQRAEAEETLEKKMRGPAARRPAAPPAGAGGRRPGVD